MRWVEERIQLLSWDTVEKGDNMAWADYHVSNQSLPTDPIGISVLVHLFQESCNDPNDMILGRLHKQNIKDIKSDCSLLSHMFVSSQVRDGCLYKSFMHEYLPWPPSLSQLGKLRLPSCKSQLLLHTPARSI